MRARVAPKLVHTKVAIQIAKGAIMSTTTKKTKPKKKPSTEMLLVGSKVKAALKDSGCNVAGDALEGLNAYVHWLVEQAAERATQNGRKTVRSHDFIVQ